MRFTNKDKFNIILPPVWSGVYVNTARLLKYSMEEMGVVTNIIEAGETEEGNLSVVLGWNLIPDSLTITQPYILYQLEPLVLSAWQDKLIQKRILFQKASAIWDYSESNARYLSHIGLHAEVIKMGYHPRLQDVSCTQYPDYDVLFVGFITERRKKIVDELQQYCCVSIQPRWGKDFSDALKRSKILLNIHQYEVSTPVEQPRIAYALNNKTFIISETATDNPYQKLVSCDYENLVSTVLHYLHHPGKRAEKKERMFNSFKEFKMTDILQHYFARSRSQTLPSFRA